MLDELDTVTSRMGELEEMIEEETDGDRDGGRRDAMMKALSLGKPRADREDARRGVQDLERSFGAARQEGAAAAAGN